MASHRLHNREVIPSERKRAEEVLRESEEKLRVMFESMSDGVAITDLKGKILDVNEAILRMSGFSREEIIGQDGFGLIPREDGKKIIEQGKKALKSETGTEKMSQEITPTSGREYDVDLSMGVLRDSSGDPTGFVAIVRDITERKQAEEALRESEEKYRALFDSTIDGVVIIDGETMKIVLANQTALKMYEFDSIEDISEINLLDYIHPDDRERAVRIIAEDMFEKDLRQVNEFRTITKDGQEKWFSALGTKIEYQGKPAGLVSFMDITERKQADEALRESEEKLRVTFESINDAVAVADLEGRLVQVNEAAVRMTGYSNKEELLGRNVLESIIAEKDRAKIMEDMAKTVEGEHALGTRSYTLLAADGREFEAEFSTAVLRDSSGNVIRFIGVARDITERKQVEEALRKSEEKYRFLYDRGPAISLIFGVDGRIVGANRAAEEMLGYSKDEYLGVNALEFIIPEHREKAAMLLEGSLRDEYTPEADIDIYAKDGSTRTILFTTGQVVLYEKGQPTGVLVSGVDITERKRAEEALRKSEEQYRLLAENVTDVIFTLDMDLRYTYISPSVTSLRGYSVEEAMAQSIEEVLTPESFEFAMKIWAEELATEKMEQKDLLRSRMLELEMRCKDGSTVWTEVKISSMRDSDGTAVGIQGVTRDITERKRAREALRKSEQQFRALIENAQDAIVIVDSDITISYESPSMERMTGRKAKDRIGKNPFDFCHPDDITEVTEAFLQLLENKIAIVHTELRLRHKNGGWRTFEVVGNNLFDDPAVGGIVLNMRDITERKRAEKEIRRLNEELEQRVVERTRQLQAVNKELEAFAYSVSHDLRAPLRSIDGFSQVLLEDYTDRLDEEGKNHLQRVRSASQRMAQLIDDLLNLSRLTRGKMRYETVDLSALAQTVAMELQQSQPERDVEFTIAPGLVAKGDAHFLRVALENLLGNSWKFAKKRGRTRIEFGYDETNGRPSYFVRDNGVGFDMAYADKLFGAFQRLHSHSEFEGSGIGLATVQRIIHRHGGDIWAESAVGQGATFYFTL